MSRHVRILIVFLVLLFLSVFVVAFLIGPRDPELQGKRLSVWIKEFDSWNWPTKPQTKVLRQYGSSAAPLLRRMLRSRDSSIETKLLKLLSKQNLIKIQIPPASVAQHQALEICNLLGADVRKAVPEIEALVNEYPGTLKNSMIANHALNTLAVMGPDGTQALLQALTNQNTLIRIRAAELLGTSAFAGTGEVIAELTKCLTDVDASMQREVSRSLALIGERRAWHPPAGATNWMETAESAIKPPFSLWDITQGIRILSDSGLEQGQGTLRAEDLFGGNLSVTSSGESGTAIFNDSRPDGFIHFIEWETAAPVTIRSFGLLASHDGALYAFQRALRSFKLYARRDDSEPYKLVYAENIPVPYGQGPFSCMLYLFRNLDAPVVARQFRAEFVQNGQGAWHGPRASELYGFAVPLNLPMMFDALRNQDPYVQDEARRLFHR
jgi:hypothetical protein